MSHIFLNGQAIRANNIFCIGRNYVAHIAELGNETPSEPLVFLKPNSASGRVNGRQEQTLTGRPPP